MKKVLNALFFMFLAAIFVVTVSCKKPETPAPTEPTVAPTEPAPAPTEPAQAPTEPAKEPGK